MINKWNYLAFEMTDEAFIEQGFQVTFNKDMTLKESKKILKMP